MPLWVLVALTDFLFWHAPKVALVGHEGEFRGIWLGDLQYLQARWACNALLPIIVRVFENKPACRADIGTPEAAVFHGLRHDLEHDSCRDSLQAPCGRRLANSKA